MKGMEDSLTLKQTEKEFIVIGNIKSVYEKVEQMDFPREKSINSRRIIKNGIYVKVKNGEYLFSELKLTKSKTKRYNCCFVV